MASIKISELTALTPPAATDELVVVDLSATSTKKTTVGEVVGIITGDVEVASNGTATISELPVSKLQDGVARQLLQTDAAGTGVEWTSNIDIPGTLDVTGAAVFDSSVSVTGTLTKSGSNVVTVGDTGTVTSTMLLNGTIVDGDINASAGIADTKLATISTAGKVSNSATTATNANTASAIVARDASGNFSAGTVTASLTGAASLNVLKAGDTMTGSLTVPLGSASAPSITFAGDLNTGIYSPAADTIALAEGGTEAIRIDSSGRLLVGTSTSISVGNIVGGAQFASASTFGTTNAYYSNSGTGCIFSLGKSRATAVSSLAIVQAGDVLGEIRFAGDDGTDLNSYGASIRAIVDGTPGVNDMPGMLLFETTADGASSPTERLRITSAGVLQIADAGNIAVGTTTGTKIGTATTQKLGFFNKTPVVQPTAVADATDAASVITQLNALLSRMRDLGLIAT